MLSDPILILTCLVSFFLNTFRGTAAQVSGRPIEWTISWAVATAMTYICYVVIVETFSLVIVREMCLWTISESLDLATKRATEHLHKMIPTVIGKCIPLTQYPLRKSHVHWTWHREGVASRIEESEPYSLCSGGNMNAAKYLHPSHMLACSLMHRRHLIPEALFVASFRSSVPHEAGRCWRDLSLDVEKSGLTLDRDAKCKQKSLFEPSTWFAPGNTEEEDYDYDYDIPDDGISMEEAEAVNAAFEQQLQHPLFRALQRGLERAKQRVKNDEDASPADNSNTLIHGDERSAMGNIDTKKGSLFTSTPHAKRSLRYVMLPLPFNGGSLPLVRVSWVLSFAELPVGLQVICVEGLLLPLVFLSPVWGANSHSVTMGAGGLWILILLLSILFPSSLSALFHSSKIETTSAASSREVAGVRSVAKMDESVHSSEPTRHTVTPPLNEIVPDQDGGVLDFLDGTQHRNDDDDDCDDEAVEVRPSTVTNDEAELSAKKGNTRDDAAQVCDNGDEDTASLSSEASDLSRVDLNSTINADEYDDWVASDPANRNLLVLSSEFKRLEALIAKDAKWGFVKRRIIETGQAEKHRQMQNIEQFKAQQLRRRIKAIQRVAARQRRIRTAFCESAAAVKRVRQLEHFRWVRVRVMFKAVARTIRRERWTVAQRWRRIRGSVRISSEEELRRRAELLMMSVAEEEMLSFLREEMAQRGDAESKRMAVAEAETRSFNALERGLELASREAMDAEDVAMRRLLADEAQALLDAAQAEASARCAMEAEEAYQHRYKHMFRRRAQELLMLRSWQIQKHQRLEAERLLQRRRDMRVALLKHSHKLIRQKFKDDRDKKLRKLRVCRSLLAQARMQRRQRARDRALHGTRLARWRPVFRAVILAALQYKKDEKSAKRERKCMREEERLSSKARVYFRKMNERAQLVAEKAARKAERNAIRLQRARDKEAKKNERRRSEVDEHDSDASVRHSRDNSDNSDNSDSGGHEVAKAAKARLPASHSSESDHSHSSTEVSYDPENDEDVHLATAGLSESSSGLSVEDKSEGESDDDSLLAELRSNRNKQESSRHSDLRSDPSSSSSSSEDSDANSSSEDSKSYDSEGSTGNSSISTTSDGSDSSLGDSRGDSSVYSDSDGSESESGSGFGSASDSSNEPTGSSSDSDST